MRDSFTNPMLPPPEQSFGPAPGARSDFRSTHWSVVQLAAGKSSPESSAALEQLCRAYWRPLYAFVRREGHSPEEAKDLTQEFFRGLLANQGLAGVNPGKGRFRTFLLASIKNLMVNEWHRARTQKRGGDAMTFSLDEKSEEERYHAELADTLTPEKLFDRRWAEALLERVLLSVREEWDRGEPDQRFEDLKVFLVERRGTVSFAEGASRHGVTVPALRSMVYRLRKSYREKVVEEISHTVSTPEEIEDEVRHLFLALGD